MGGPARGALGSRGENARPCRDPPDASRTRERKSERTRDRGEGIGGGERLGEKRDPMVEASNGGISDPRPGEEERKRGPEVKEALSR